MRPYKINKNIGCLCLLSLLPVAVSCQTRSRHHTVDLGDKPITAERSATAVFEMRQGIYATIPQDLLDNAGAFILDYLQKNNTQESAPKPQKQNVTGGQIETDIGKSSFTFCSKDLSIHATDTRPTKLLLTMKSCGFKMDVIDSRAALRFDGVLRDKPIVLSVGHITLDDRGAEHDIKILLDIGFNRKSQVYVNSIKVIAGFDELADARNYRMDLNYTGFEANTGIVGDEIHAIRKQLLESILAGVRNFAESALTNSVERSVLRATDKANNQKATDIVASFRTDIDIFEMLGAVQLRSLVSNQNGLGVSAHVTSSIGIKPGAKVLPCKISFNKSPSADPRADYEAIQDLAFEDNVTGEKNRDSNSLQSTFLIPEAFLNHQLWQLFGDSGHCVIDIPLPEDIKGSITLDYDQSVNLTLDPPDARFKSKNGAMLTTTFPTIKVTLSKEILTYLEKSNISLKNTLKGRTNFEIKDFRHAVLLKIDQGKVTLVPHPAIETIYEEGFREGATAHIDTINNYLQNMATTSKIPPGFTSTIPDDAIAPIKTILFASLDFIYKNTIRENSFSVETGSGSLARIENISASGHMLKAEVSIDQKDKLIADAVGARLTSIDNSPFDQKKDLSKIDIAGLVDAIDLTYSQMLGQIRQGAFFPSDWRCTLINEEAIGIPIDDRRITYVSYAICGPNADPEVELRWQFEAPTGTVPEVQRIVSYIRLRHLRPAAVKVGLKIEGKDLKADGSKEMVTTKSSAKFLWDLPHHFIATQGFCLFDQDDCNEKPTAAQIFDVEILKK